MTWYDYLLVIAIAVGGVFTLSLFTGHYPALLERTPGPCAAKPRPTAPRPAARRPALPQDSESPQRPRKGGAPGRTSSGRASDVPRVPAARPSPAAPAHQPLLPPPFATATPTRLPVPTRANPAVRGGGLSPRNGVTPAPTRTHAPRPDAESASPHAPRPSPQSRRRPAASAPHAI